MMKRLFAVILICLASFLFVGCFVTPVDPDPIPNPDIICEGGIYYEDFDGLCFNYGCPDEVCYSIGTYWYNEDGRIFLIGETVWPDNPINVYGECPLGFMEEILVE